MSERESTEIAVTPEEPRTVAGAIIALARDPSVDPAKLAALWEIQKSMENRQAEVEFSEAFARVAAQMPRVQKNGRVTLIRKDGTNGGTYPFAKWEDIDRLIKPILSAEGFALSFDSVPRSADGGGLVVTGTLLHHKGHTRTASMPLPFDSGPGRNNLQATGSTLSYGKRYCAEMLLNIVREGEDNDGQDATELISDEECAELARSLTETGSNTDAFLQFMGVTAIPDISKRDLTRARNAINQKRQRAKT